MRELLDGCLNVHEIHLVFIQCMTKNNSRLLAKSILQHISHYEIHVLGDVHYLDYLVLLLKSTT